MSYIRNHLFQEELSTQHFLMISSARQRGHLLWSLRGSVLSEMATWIAANTAIWGRTGAYLDDKVWSANGDVLLGEAGKAGVHRHGSESEEAVLWQALFKTVAEQGGRDFLIWNM